MCKASLVPPKQPVLSILVWSVDTTQLTVTTYVMYMTLFQLIHRKIQLKRQSMTGSPGQLDPVGSTCNCLLCQAPHAGLQVYQNLTLNSKHNRSTNVCIGVIHSIKEAALAAVCAVCKHCALHAGITMYAITAKSVLHLHAYNLHHDNIHLVQGRPLPRCQQAGQRSKLCRVHSL